MDEVKSVHTVIKKAGILHSNVLIYIRYYTPHHPQYLYREARFVADDTLLPSLATPFNQLTAVADEYAGGLYDVHEYERDPALSLSCFGVKRSLPTIWQGYLFLAVQSLDTEPRQWIHGRLRSEPHWRGITRALSAV